MSIITIAYFKGEIDVPNKSAIPVQETVARYISTHEPLYLQKVLGYSLAKDFIAGIAVVPTPAAKWTNLLDGAEFTDPKTDFLTNWIGWKDETTFQSAIAYYVYFQLRKDLSVFTAGSGDAVSFGENTTYVSPGRKMAFAWNQMKQWNYLVWQFLWVNKSDYGLVDTDFGSFYYNGGTQYFLKAADYINMTNSINDFDL